MPKIFISHSTLDEQIADTLVEFLLSSLDIKDTDIICTSVPGHTLPIGENIAGCLKHEITESSVVIPLLTHNSLNSSWVMFEIGAAWALGKKTYSIMGLNITDGHLQGPLKGRIGVQINDANASGRMRTLVEQVAENLSIEQRHGEKSQAKLDRFIASFRQNNEAPDEPNNTSTFLPAPPTPDSDGKTSMLLALWSLDNDDNPRAEKGYRISAIASTSGVQTSKCDYFLDELFSEGKVGKHGYRSGGEKFHLYTLKQPGRKHLFSNNLV